LTLDDVRYLFPELILLLTGVLVFGLDAVWGRRALAAGGDPCVDTGPQRNLPYVALAGLALALVSLGLTGGGVHQVATMLAFDPFAVFFKALAILAVAVVILTAIPYMQGRTPYRGEFYALLLVTALAICLAVSATNLVMVYLGMEFLSITSYVLAGYIRNDRQSGEAAIKYFLYGATASAVMLYGMSLLYGMAGTTDLGALSTALANNAGGQLSLLAVPAIVLLLAGFGFKASLAPFHQWAPDTYEGAPTPVTVFLSTASKATGFAILIRVFLVGMGQLQGDWSTVLIVVAMLTMTIGNLTALRQTNMKRLLAYSSIAQAGYMLMGVAAVQLAPTSAGAQPTFTGINGVLIYLFAYLFTNAGAFAVVIAVENATGKTTVKDYAGLVQRAPWLAGILFIFLVSLAGIPPTGGFIGKFFVFGAAVQRQLWALAAVAAVNSVIAAFYYLNVVRYMFFTPAEETGKVAVAPSLTAALMVTAVLTLLLGLAPAPLIDWAARSVQLLALK
jgi:NADH-quinone oxidoreductase subunit N